MKSILLIFLFIQQQYAYSKDRTSFDHLFNLKKVQEEVTIDDIIELNVGGQKITTLRSTLAAIPNSKLALMFSRNNTKRTLAIDKQGAIFFDYNPTYFNYLLDQLRAIKQIPRKSGYLFRFSSPPYMIPHVNFTQMLADFGLTADQLLSPVEGTHVNLTVNSLAGWQECYRTTYDIAFDFSVLSKQCNGSQLLVGCRSIDNKKVLTVAGIGQREDILHPCLPKQCKKSTNKTKKLICSVRHQCLTQGKRGVGWYHVNNQTWGFVRGSLSFAVNPCDASNLDSDYRLCWTVQSKHQGDRCGRTKDLHNSNKWERLIYHIN